jgi:catechol 2,3-dioxygenase-like lactoylglutathione lyase family enzyme
MANCIAGIDHVIAGVRHLEEGRASYERLGFRPTPRGRHVGWGTANYCIMFPDDYLELLGIVDPSKFTNDLDRFLEDREGLMALALRSSDADGTHGGWRAAGLEPNPVGDLSRLLEPDVELHFKNVMLPPEATGGVPLFACVHLTPEPMRRPEWLDHPNGAVAIASLTVAVEEPGALSAAMGRVFGTDNLTETDDTLAVHTGHGMLLLATPDDLEMLHPELEPLAIDRLPALAVLTLVVHDIGWTADYLDRQDVPYRRNAAGALGLSPTDTHGVMLEFVASAAATERSSFW